MATTEAAVIDRIRDVMADLNFVEAPWDDFARTPQQMTDRAFALQFTTRAPIGQMGMHEEVQGECEIQWLRHTNADQVARRSALWTDIRSVTAAVVRDGVVSGEYAVDDAGGRGASVVFPAGSTFGRAAVRLPVNFEATF